MRTASRTRTAGSDEALVAAGRYAEAVDLCDEVIRTSDTADAAHGYARRAGARLRSGDAAGASRDLDEAIRLEPRHGYVLAYALSFRSWTRLTNGDLRAALADAERAVDAFPTHADAYVRRAAARTALGDVDGAAADADEAVRLEPRSVTARCARGNARFGRGDAEGAVADYDEAVRLSPNNPQVLASRASGRMAAGDLAGAAADADRAVQLAPDDAEMHAARGAVWHQRGEAEIAATCYEEALRLGSKQMLAANNLAWLLATSPDPAKRDGRRAMVLARQAYEAASWRSADSLGTLAAATAECGDFAEAIRLLERAVRLDSRGFNAGKRWRMLSAFRHRTPFRDTTSSAGSGVSDPLWRAMSLVQHGRHRETLAACDAAAQLAAVDPTLLGWLGTLRRACGDAAGAVTCYEAALRIDRDDDFAHNGLAWLLACDPDAAHRDGRRAIEHVTEACRLSGGTNYDWLDTLAAAYAEAGEFAKAVVTQRRSIELAPESEHDDLRSRLTLYEAGRPYRDAGAIGLARSTDGRETP